MVLLSFSGNYKVINSVACEDYFFRILPAASCHGRQEDSANLCLLKLEAEENVSQQYIKCCYYNGVG
ncbi:hypothetical protein [Desulforhopalus sp. 52FAK]